MPAPALVLFDLDGVLVHYDHAARLQTLAQRSGASVKAVAQALFESGLESDADLGRFDARGQVDELARRLGMPVTLDDCIAARRAATSVDRAVLSLAARIARQAGVAILTNNNLLLRDHLPAICPPLLPLFAGRVFCSAQFGLAKPDPGIFRSCLAILAVRPEQAVFIDDKAENAEAAGRVGLQSHHYRDLPTLRAELHVLGLAPD